MLEIVLLPESLEQVQHRLPGGHVLRRPLLDPLVRRAVAAPALRVVRLPHVGIGRREPLRLLLIDVRPRLDVVPLLRAERVLLRLPAPPTPRPPKSAWRKPKRSKKCLQLQTAKENLFFAKTMLLQK